MASALLSTMGWFGSTIYYEIRDTSHILLETQEHLTAAIVQWKEAENRNMDAIRGLHTENGMLKGRIKSIERYMEVTRGEDYQVWQNQQSKHVKR